MRPKSWKIIGEYYRHVEDACALIRSDDRQSMAALGDLTIDEVDHMNGDEPENPGDSIHMDDDSAFTTYRDNAEDS